MALTPLEIIRWHPTEEAITFLRPAGGGINVFSQPLSGGNPKQITSFKSGTITSFDWTAGRKLILTGGEVRADVVLISNIK